MEAEGIPSEVKVLIVVLNKENDTLRQAEDILWKLSGFGADENPDVAILHMPKFNANFEQLGFAGFVFHEAPEDFKYSVGGDEDFVVVLPAKSSHSILRIANNLAERLAVCDSTEIQWDNKTFFVATHA